MLALSCRAPKSLIISRHNSIAANPSPALAEELAYVHLRTPASLTCILDLEAQELAQGVSVISEYRQREAELPSKYTRRMA
jgi:hypothetical protein